ncbi:hypothetical protein JCGZ_21168 [Jatropha curcas]|uniref:Uncharacterized protein n=1 Tax=Jatropha curcas TaxID=180498 RepID=A0A067JAB4_JATCU|nr:uncharacterized protein At4g22160 [Jatropha curcas]KDP20697.1 hypothetical protein JCGZ_21168 [Jatropha curcas]
MADPTSRTRAQMAPTNDDNRLKCACDAGILSDACPYDNANDHDIDSEDSNQPQSSDSESCESTRLDDLAASCFRVFSDSLSRMELAEMEMIRARETSRWEAEKRRMELDAELTRMMLRTQLQIASVVAGKGPNKKRKRVEQEEDESAISTREGALLLSLLQCNFSF